MGLPRYRLPAACAPSRRAPGARLRRRRGRARSAWARQGAARASDVRGRNAWRRAEDGARRRARGFQVPRGRPRRDSGLAHVSFFDRRRFPRARGGEGGGARPPRRLARAEGLRTRRPRLDAGAVRRARQHRRYIQPLRHVSDPRRVLRRRGRGYTLLRSRHAEKPQKYKKMLDTDPRHQERQRAGKLLPEGYARALLRPARPRHDGGELRVALEQPRPRQEGRRAVGALGKDMRRARGLPAAPHPAGREKLRRAHERIAVSELPRQAARG